MLAPSIVPRKASFAITEGATPEEPSLNQKAKVFTQTVKMKFSSGSNERMSADDDDALSTLSRQTLEADAEVDFFAGEQFFAESANFSKRCCLAKYE